MPPPPRRALVDRAAAAEDDAELAEFDDDDDEGVGCARGAGTGAASSDDESDSDSDSDDDDDDDAAELYAELERIKAEREVERSRRVEEEAQLEEKAKQATALQGNPLLQAGAGGRSDARLKRRWDDDVVFRNQARGAPETKKRFINDTIRNDFHRRFLNKFIQ